MKFNMTNPFNIAFIISSQEIRDGDRSYQKTITNYRLTFGGTFPCIPVAYVKIPEHEKNLLPDIIDFLLDNDVKPIIVEEGFDAKVFPQQERSKDIFKLFSTNDIQNYPYTLFVGNGWLIRTSRDAKECVMAGVLLLSQNKDILSVAFEDTNIKGSEGATFIPNQSLTSRPIIVRSRDMMIASKFVVDNANQLAQLSSEQSISHLFGAFSYHPYKFVSFSSQLAYSL
jgi:hypothetical protein